MTEPSSTTGDDGGRLMANVVYNMASSVRNLEKYKLIFQCCMCNELVNPKKAKLMPCLHTICSPCEISADKKDNRITCIKCKLDWSVNDVVENHLVRTYAVIKCTSCPNSTDVEVAEYKCASCGENEFLCNTCADAHRRVKFTKNHSLTLLSETCPSNDTCSKHSDCPMDCYCVMCDDVVCVECRNEKHNSHPMQSLEDKTKRYNENLNKSLAKLNDLSSQLHEWLIFAEKNMQAVDEREKNLKNELMLLLNEIETICREKRNPYDEIKLYIEHFLTRANQATSFIEATIECQNKFVIHNVKDFIDNTYQGMIDQFQEAKEVMRTVHNVTSLPVLKFFNDKLIVKVDDKVSVTINNVISETENTANRDSVSSKCATPVAKTAEQTSPLITNPPHITPPHLSYEQAQQMSCVLPIYPSFGPSPTLMPPSQPYQQQAIYPRQMVSPVGVGCSPVVPAARPTAAPMQYCQRPGYPNVPIYSGSSVRPVYQQQNLRYPNHQQLGLNGFCNSLTLPEQQQVAQKNVELLQQVVPSAWQNGNFSCVVGNNSRPQTCVVVQRTQRNTVQNVPAIVVRDLLNMPMSNNSAWPQTGQGVQQNAIAQIQSSPYCPPQYQNAPLPPPSNNFGVDSYRYRYPMVMQEQQQIRFQYSPHQSSSQASVDTTFYSCRYNPPTSGTAGCSSLASLPMIESLSSVNNSNARLQGLADGSNATSVPSQRSGIGNITVNTTVDSSTLQVRKRKRAYNKRSDLESTKRRIVAVTFSDSTTASRRQNLSVAAETDHFPNLNQHPRSRLPSTPIPNLEPCVLPNSATDSGSNISPPNYFDHSDYSVAQLPVVCSVDRQQQQQENPVTVQPIDSGDTKLHQPTGEKTDEISAAADSNQSPTNSCVTKQLAKKSISSPSVSPPVVSIKEIFSVASTSAVEMTVHSSSGTTVSKCSQNNTVVSPVVATLTQSPGVGEVTTTTTDDVEDNDRLIIDDEWHAECSVCQDYDGPMLQCSGANCYQAFHLDHHIPEYSDIPDGNFVCGFCINPSILKTAEDSVPYGSRSSKSLTKFERKVCECILLKLYCHCESLPFHTIEKGFYDNITPMDFGIIKCKLRNEGYRTLEQFLKDVNQIFINCSNYNELDSEIGQKGQVVGRDYLQWVKEYIPYMISFVKLQEH